MASRAGLSVLKPAKRQLAAVRAQIRSLEAANSQLFPNFLGPAVFSPQGLT